LFFYSTISSSFFFFSSSSAVSSLLLRGKKDHVRRLLLNFNTFPSNVSAAFVKTLADTISQMPRYSTFLSKTEFIAAWNQWQQDCT